MLYNRNKAKNMYPRFAFSLLFAVSLFGQAQKPDVAPTSQAPAPVASSAQPSPATNQPPPIQVQVNEVIVPVTVTDEKGRFVSDLDQKDFDVYDEGKQQQIQFFTRERSQPVVVGFLIDLSNSSRLHWKNYQDAAV
jgi:hypothetical protein